MIDLQQPEWAARLRRGGGLVGGGGTRGLEEVYQPIVVVADVTRPPFRSEPRSFRSMGTLTGAVGADRNIIGCSLAAADPGCALITEVTMSAREVPTIGAALILQHLLMIGTHALADLAGVPTVELLEPVSRPAAATMNQLPPRMQGITTEDTLTIEGSVIAEHTVAMTSAVGLLLTKTWDLRDQPILIGAGQYTWVGGTVNALVAAAPVEVGLSVAGVYYNRYPLR